MCRRKLNSKSKYQRAAVVAGGLKRAWVVGSKGVDVRAGNNGTARYFVTSYVIACVTRLIASRFTRLLHGEGVKGVEETEGRGGGRWFAKGRIDAKLGPRGPINQLTKLKRLLRKISATGLRG